MSAESARYRKARKFLDRLVNWERSVGLTFNDWTMRLDLFRENLATLGSPQDDYKIAIVAGTKGKGSTAAILARLLRAHGLKTGLFTSPHLMSIRERIQVDGTWISREEFADAVDALQGALPYFDEPGESRTYFESLTAAGLWQFSQARCDVAVLEVGLGGRLDATNATSPDVSIITPISRDHFQTLGKTTLAIAAEKAGVLRPRKPAIIGRQRADVRRFLEERATELGSPMCAYGTDYRARTVSVEPEGTRFHYSARDGRGYRALELSLLGGHQAHNAATAIAALPALGIEPVESSVRAACSSVTWAGRGEFLSHDPPILLDGAHNGDSAGVIRRLAEQLWPEGRCLLLFAGSRGKEYRVIFQKLLPLAEAVILTESTHPRHLPVDELEDEVRKVDRDIPVTSIPDWRIALEAARTAQGGRPLLITGSLYLAGELRAAFPSVLAEAEAG